MVEGKDVIFRGEKIKVEKLYIGRDGCRCGCGGKYVRSLATIKKHLVERGEVFEKYGDLNQGFRDEWYTEIGIGYYANGDAKYMTLYFEYEK
jgi:hypothetical protein